MKALVITVGSIVPGVNVVIREVVCTLTYVYGVNKVYGSKFGFSGLVEENFVQLKPEEIKNIHKQGGSFLGVSRSDFDKD